MRKLLLAVLASFALVVTAAPAAHAETPGDFIIVLKDSTDSQTVAKEHTRKHKASLAKVFGHALSGYSAKMTPSVSRAIAKDSRVLWVERDRVVNASVQTLPTGINRVNADAAPTAAINGVDTRVNVDVAVIDTGIDLDHPDLNVYTAGAKNCSTGSSADDGNGHGTHVAGTIGALDNTSGVVGVAPGARVWPVRVLNNSGSGSYSSIICGIDFVTSRAGEIEVANMSLGGVGTDDRNCGNSNGDSMHRAICRSVAAGVTYAVAAGNESTNSANRVPASYDEVITVSALADFNGLPGGGAASTCRSDVDDTFANFSNYGADVDLIAPGVCIYSTWLGGGYNTISGTSMASPHVAGGAALYKATHPTATPAAVKSALQSAGTTDWNNSDDRDSIKERLLNVTGF